MPSLSTKAGSKAPKNFAIYDRFWKPVTRRLTINGTFDHDAFVGTFQMAHNIDIYDGRVLNDFHQRKNSGELLPYTKYTFFRCTTSVQSDPFAFGPAPSHVYTFRDSDGNTLGGAIPFQGTVMPIDINASLTGMDNLIRDLGVDLPVLVQEAASRIYGRGWDGLTFLAELHKLVRMIKRLIPKLYMLGRRILKHYRNPRLWRDLGFGSFNAWLESRYGWRILIYDIIDIDNLFRSLDEEQRSRVKDRVGRDIIHQLDNSFESGNNHRIQTYDTTEYSIGIRGSIIADFSPDDIVTNPVLTLWEIVPFSFVLDWIIDIGRFLEAASFSLAASKYTACTGVSITATREASHSVSFYGTWSPDGHSTYDSVQLTQTIEYRQRQPITVPNSPSLNVNLDTFKIIDLIALAVQFLRRMVT